MSWGSWTEFWTMGGYGLYVWGSYAVTFILMAGEVLQLRARKRAAVENVKRVKAQQGEIR